MNDMNGNDRQKNLENQVLHPSSVLQKMERTWKNRASKSCHVMTHAQLLLLFASAAPFDIVKITFQKDWTPFWQATR